MSTVTRVNPDPPSIPKAKGVVEEDDEDVSTVERVLRTVIDGVLHYLPQIIILIACIPVLLLVSLVAGYIVRNSVPRGWERRVFLRYGESPIPTAYFQLPSLVPDQAYDISVHLTVPLTESNAALGIQGNFMTYLTFTNAANKTVASANRPVAILPPPKRSLMRRMLPYTTREHQTLSIQLLTYWKPYTSSPLEGKLEIGRRDGWKSLGAGEGRELTVIEAYVRGNVQLEGTRRVVGTYPNLAGLLSSGIFFMTATMGLVLCFYRFAAPFEGGYRRGPRGAVPIVAGGGGRPLPPRPMPKTLDRRPRTWRADDEGSTPRGFVKREMSPSLSVSSSEDLPTIPTPESVLLHQREQQGSDPFVEVTTDEESATVSP